ncbi:MAG: Trans-2,3-dihydro-3-hydroxyanthranilate isomerase [Holosporales bacterium]
MVSNKKRMKYWTIDVFSKTPFSGNSAGIFLNAKPLDDALYQRLALELFQPETAFLTPIENMGGHYSIRFFTPYKEKMEHGYSIFGAALVLWEENNYPKDQPIYFECLGKIQKVFYKDGMICAPLPCSPVLESASPDRLFKALGTLPVSVSQSQGDLIVELHNSEELATLEVDLAKLATIEYNRIIVTCEDQSENYDYVYRIFSPRMGADEESANLQSHSDLASFWAKQTDKKFFKTKQVGLKTGETFVYIEDGFITLSGTAIVVASGAFRNNGLFD